MIRVDVKKIGKIPDGGGHRFVGRKQGNRNIAATVARRNEGENHPGDVLAHAAVR